MNRPPRPSSPDRDPKNGAPRRGTYSSGDGTRITYRRRRAAPITGTLIYALLFVLILLICILVIARSRGDDPSLSPDNAVSDSTGNPTDSASDSHTPETAAPTVPPHETVTLPNTAAASGNLILINADHPYVFPEKQPQTVLYGNKSPVYVLSTSSISLNTELFPIFDGMIVDFSEASGCTNLLVTSGYRSYEIQETLYSDRVASHGAEQAALYVALPGYSEHHAGLAIDMVIFADGRQYYFPEYPDAAWLIEHAPDYGFFLRYTEEAQPITKCAPEPWHYRYVGAPHARLITDLGLCFEEYHEYLRTFTWEGERLHITEEGTVSVHTGASLPDGGYLIYRVAAAADTTETGIPVPTALPYEISGDNTGGFIVTVTLPKRS